MIEKLGTVKKVELGPEDHGINTLMITLDIDYYTQGFGGYALGEVGSWVEQDLVRRLCDVCEVSDLDQLVGKQMIVLYPEGGDRIGHGSINHGERIIGIKNPDTGDSFTYPEWTERIEVMDRLKGEKYMQEENSGTNNRKTGRKRGQI